RRRADAGSERGRRPSRGHRRASPRRRSRRGRQGVDHRALQPGRGARAGDASVKNISGPITLADYAGQSAKGGLLSFASFIALVSISLGVLNLLPVPLLDGGHLLYYFAEFIKGAPISDRAFEVGQRIGMAILAVLMSLALFNDVFRLL